jgi:hypothetical protein
MTAQTRTLASNIYPPQPLAPAIADKLHAAEASLRRLEEGLPGAALDTALNKPGAAAALAELRTRIADARGQREDLVLALLLARKQDALADLEQWLCLAKLQRRAVERHAKARLDAVIELSVGSIDLEESRRRFMRETARMEAAVPIGCSLPRGALLLGSATEVPAPDVVKSANDVVCDSIKAQLSSLERLRRAKIEAEWT